MTCPVCKVDLLITDKQGIEIDYCSNAEVSGLTGAN
jgi:Zn-finger nucleic acid-binding protein